MDTDAHANVERSSSAPATSRNNGIYWPGATIILLNCTLGAGLLALPYAFAEVGSLPITIVIQLLVCVPVSLSVVVLGYCAAFPAALASRFDSAREHRASSDERTPLLGATHQLPAAQPQPYRTQAPRAIQASDEPTYERVCGRIGRPASFAASLAVALYTYTSCVALLVIIGDNLDKLFLCAFGDRFCDQWYLNRQFTIPASATVFILPLCFARRMDFLKIPSTIGVLGLFYVVALVVLKYILPDAPTSVCRNAPTPISHNSSDDLSFAALLQHSAQQPTDNSTRDACVCSVDAKAIYLNATLAGPSVSAVFTALHSVSVFCLSYQSHVSAVPVFACLARPRVGEWARAVFASYLLCSLVYVCVGVFGYDKFGDRVQSDVLNNYAPDAFVLVAIALLALKLCVTYPTSSLVGCQTLLGYVDQLRGCLRACSTPQAHPHDYSVHNSSTSEVYPSINNGDGVGGGSGSLGRLYSNEITFSPHASVYSPAADPPEPGAAAGNGAPAGAGVPHLHEGIRASVDALSARVPCALLWFVLSLLPALLVRSLGQVIGVLGSIAALLMFFFPGLALLGVARDLKRLRSSKHEHEHVPHSHPEEASPAAAAASSASTQSQPHLQVDVAIPTVEQTPPSPSYTQSTLVAHGGGDGGDSWHHSFFGFGGAAAPTSSGSRRGIRGRHYTPPPLDATSPALLSESHSELATAGDAPDELEYRRTHLARTRGLQLAFALLYMVLGVLLFIYMLYQSIVDLVSKPAAAC